MRYDPSFPKSQNLDDPRFRNLLGDDNWNTLPPAIRRRFGKRVKGGASIAYQGVISHMKMSLAGWCLAQAARLIGAPLPYDRDSNDQPAVVVVTEDSASNGQFWIRQYGRKSGFPQIVHSSKRFAGPTGLEEYIGYGIGMALRVEARDDALIFKSDHYFLSVMGRRLRLPRWLSPGALVIGHHDLDDGAFRFSLHLRHGWFGDLIRQDAIFQEGEA